MTHYSDCLAPTSFRRVLRQFATKKLLRQALAFRGRASRQRKLPAASLILLLITTFLQGTAGLPAVLAWLQFGPVFRSLTDQALYRARQRLGWRPLWFLRQRLTWLADPAQDPSAFYRGRRLLIVDGTTLTVADTPANVATFGKSRNQYKHSGFPLLRLVVLCELGTRTFVRWRARAYRTSEVPMTLQLLRYVPHDALLIGDRNFHSYNLWEQAKKRGFALLLRVQAGVKLPVLKRFPDGSYLSTIVPRRGKKKKERALSVRVIRAFVIIHDEATEYRLVTNCLDPNEAPAKELVALDAKRWEIETAFAEFKSQLRERTTLLRAHQPLIVMAELDALLLGYYMVRRVALQAARQEGVDPLSISFQHTVQMLKCYILGPRLSDRSLYESVARRQNRRRPRRYRRCRKVTRCKWPVKTKDDVQVKYRRAKIVIRRPEVVS